MKKNFFVFLAACVIAVMPLVSCQDITGAGEGTTSAESGLSLARSVSVGQTPISNQVQLMRINSNPSGDYVLTASFPVNNWTPICNPDLGNQPFTGTLDGAGFTITVNSFSSGALSGEHLGIFAETDAGATISGLTVNYATAPVVTATAQYVGGVVAYAQGTRFDSVNVTGSLDLVSSFTSGDVNDSLDVGLVIGYAGVGTSIARTNVEANLNVQYNGSSTTTLNAGGVVGSLLGSDVRDATVDGHIIATTGVPYTYTAGNSLRLGGVAGYAEKTNLGRVTIDVSTTVEADSEQTPVYVGGIVGRGLSASIERSTSFASITGNGPAYDTSAGGVAGYIVQSMVFDSEAHGDVALGATWETGSYDYWQVYAGGLVGYSGGNENGGSVIEHSHASGNVTANSVYPYAGGLVGYNYGYIVFTSPEERLNFYRYHKVGASATSNGSRILRSYATGNASATSTSGSNGLPYAGGLAGYSSISTNDGLPNIENSYARGNATATTDSMYAWAGGLLGANAQGSLVSMTYATGTVSAKVGTGALPYEQPGINPGAAVGSIVGVNYYVEETTGRAAKIQYSVGLSLLIQASRMINLKYRI